MKKRISVIVMMLVTITVTLSAQADNGYNGEDYFDGGMDAAASYAPGITSAATPASAQKESEAMKKLEAIRNQEQWVEKLQKQLAGETSQLNEMRSSLAQSFGLDVKKLEKGAYHYDAKSGKIVEK